MQVECKAPRSPAFGGRLGVFGHEDQYPLGRGQDPIEHHSGADRPPSGKAVSITGTSQFAPLSTLAPMA